MMVKSYIHVAARSLCFLYWRTVRHGVSIFNFHQVSDNYDSRIHNPDTYTMLSDFKRTIEYLSTHYHWISLSEAIEILNKGHLKENYAVLTFDDGDASIKEVIPYLNERQIPATLFINTGYLDNTKKSWVNAIPYFAATPADKFPKEIYTALKSLRRTSSPQEYRDNYPKVESFINSVTGLPPQYLSRQELQYIANSPLISIGMHGVEHHRFSMMSDEWVANNLEKNYEELSKYPHFIPVVAFPFGTSIDWEFSAIAYCLKRGWTVCLHNGGINTRKLPVLQRIPSDGRHWTISTLAGASMQ